MAGLRPHGPGDARAGLPAEVAPPQLRTLEAPEATPIADLAERIERRLFQAARMAGLAQAAAWESYRWLGGLALDMQIASIVIDQEFAPWSLSSTRRSTTDVDPSSRSPRGAG